MGIPFDKTESIADHMYRMSLMVQAVLKPSDPINKDKCIKMALVHDMAEAITGDITPDDGISTEEKNRLETVRKTVNVDSDVIIIFILLMFRKPWIR